MSLLVQFLIGLLFGTGLVVAGMSDPAKVLNFLDLAAIPSGNWDASLAFVMGAGVLVTYVGYYMVHQRERPLFNGAFHLPKDKTVDARVIVGPAIFGIGWGLAGFCPGPAFTALGTGSSQAVIFVAAMFVGIAGARWLAIKKASEQTSMASS
jgi:uncharacterized protein